MLCYVGLFLVLGFGEAENLVVRAVEDCWNSWKTRSVVFHSSNGFHQPVFGPGMGGPGGRGRASGGGQARCAAQRGRQDIKPAPLPPLFVHPEKSLLRSPGAFLTGFTSSEV